MTVGELFVNLGIKGTEKTVGALTSVKKGLGEMASMSLEAKAGIVAALYALERLFAISGQAGTNLTNFNAVLGVSAKTLQQYQYAARQVGVSNQEVEGSFKALQQTMVKTLMNEGIPKGLSRVSQLTGGISPQDLQKFTQNPELLIQKLQQYAQKEKSSALRNEVLKGFGVSEGMIAAMARNAFTPGQLGKAPTYGDKEISALDRANIAWSNLGTKIEMAVGHFNAKHGGQLVNDLSKITDQVFRLVNAFTKLAEQLEVFKALSAAMKELATSLEEISKWMEGKRSFWGEDLDENGKIKGSRSATGATLGNTFDFFKYWALKPSVPSESIKAYDQIAKLKPIWEQKPKDTTVNIQQDLHFQHDGKDAGKIQDSHKKAAKHAYRQNPAQSQWA